MTITDTIALLALAVSIGAFVVGWRAYAITKAQDTEERRYQRFIVETKKKYPIDTPYRPIDEVAKTDEDRYFVYRAIVDGYFTPNQSGASVHVHKSKNTL
jgi:hypothetical protein